MFLGIDLGTSSVKCILMDEAQKVLASHSQALTVSRPHPLWSEQDPNAWWQATTKTLDFLSHQFPNLMQAVNTIGLTGQMHGAVLLDANHDVLRPAILWNDGRAMLECTTLLDREPDALNITSNLIAPGFTAPKLIWLEKHEPQLFKKIRHILLPKDYLRFCFTGDFATDLSDASGTSWLDVKNRKWSSAMIKATHLEENYLPKLYEGPEITGFVSQTWRGRWQFKKEVSVIAGAGDNAASAISVNVIQAGTSFLSLGTSGVLFVADDAHHAKPERGLHSFCHCLPKRWHTMSVHLSATSCLTFAVKLLGLRDVDHLLTLAKTHQPSHTPIFLPYLSGERTPLNNAHARGVFFGLDHDSGPAEMAQAVLEGIALSFADDKTTLTALNRSLDSCAVVGGGAKNYEFGQLLANCLNQSLTYYEEAEIGGAYGAARLAWLSSQKEISHPNFVNPNCLKIIEPQSQFLDYYAQKLARFQTLYETNQPLFTANKETS